MPAAIPTATTEQVTSTSLRAKLLNIFALPDEVFDEVGAAPARTANWLVPTVIASSAGMMLSHAATRNGETSSAIGQLLTVGLAAFAGTFWSAFVLWFIGRVFLKTCFPFVKAVEVVGLTGMIVALGTVVTWMLMTISGDVAARPAGSLFLGKAGAGNRLRAVLDVLNFFHLWTTTVLAIGLSRLSRISFKESAFWVFGYWVLARIALILLA